MNNKKYAIWNNKGGVGKTFLTYALSTEYALAHPEEDVIVIDVCPQANVSEIILGGNGTGESNLNKYVNNNTTIAGYIKTRFETSAYEKIGTEISYFIKASSVNSKMPSNLYLLPGDIDLDICSKLIAHIGDAPRKGAWKISRSLLIDLINSFEKTSDRPKTFFIDCNPSFANYTELALLASNRIIIPCTADAASIRGIKNLLKLIHGVTISSGDNASNHLDDNFLDFYNEANSSALALPELHLFIQNRSRTSDKSATKAYQAHADEIDRLTTEINKNHPSIFTNVALISRVGHVKDGNTLAAIINHEGCPLSKLKHDKYDIYGQETQANKAQIDALNGDIQNIVKVL